MPYSLVQPTADASKSAATWFCSWDLSKITRYVESNYETHWLKIIKKQVDFTFMSS